MLRRYECSCAAICLFCCPLKPGDQATTLQKRAGITSVDVVSSFLWIARLGLAKPNVASRYFQGKHFQTTGFGLAFHGEASVQFQKRFPDHAAVSSGHLADCDGGNYLNRDGRCAEAVELFAGGITKNAGHQSHGAGS